MNAAQPADAEARMDCERLLVAHDGTSHGDLLLAALLRRDIHAGAVHIVHVVTHDEAAHPTIGRFARQREASLVNVYRRLHSSTAGGAWSRATIHVLTGDPADEIVALATQENVDLVALGSHGRTGLTRLALGSVAASVVRYAHCPVLVVPDSFASNDEPSPTHE